MRKVSFNVPTIVCAACTTPIESQLRAHPEVSNIHIDIVDKTVSFYAEDTVDNKQLIEDLEDVGHEVSSTQIQDMDKNLSVETDDDGNNQFDEELDKSSFYLKRALVSGILGLGLLVMTSLGVTFQTPAMIAIAISSVATSLYAGFDIYRQAYKALVKSRSLTADSLFSLSTLTALAVSFTAFFVPMFSFEFATALLIFASRHLGKYIEQKMRSRIDKNLNFCSRLPERARRLEDGNFIDIDSKTAQPGDIIQVLAGDVIPLDGIVLTGDADVARTLINGQLLPEPVAKGMALYAGMTVNKGAINIKVTKKYADCYLKSLDTELKEARKQRAPSEEISQKIIHYFIPTVLLVSVISAAVIFPLYGITMALHTGLGILVGACPCTLGLIVPLANKIALIKSAETGAVINQATAIEAAGNIDTVVFDLNGTLTTGKPCVKKLSILDENATNSKRVLSLLWSLEGSLDKRNLCGNALYHYANKQLAKPTQFVVSNIKHQNMPGMSAIIEGERYLLGNAKLMQDNGINIGEHARTSAQQIYLAKENQVIAQLELEDALRADAIASVKALQAHKKVMLCTGADHATAVTYANRLGIATQNVIADCVGGIEKNKKIKALNAENKLAFVGDAANDTLALKTAALGIALNNADSLSKAHADVSLSQDCLSPLLSFFKVSEMTNRIIKQNFAITMAYNLAVVFLCCGLAASLGMMAPGTMAFCMSVQAAIVLANTTRIWRAKVIETTPEVDKKPSFSSMQDTLAAPSDNLAFENQTLRT